MHASVVLTPSNTTLFWPVFPYLIGNSSEIMILTVKCIQLEQLKKQTWKNSVSTRIKFAFSTAQVETFKNCKPFMATFVTSGSSHLIYFICIHLQKNWILLGNWNCFLIRSTNVLNGSLELLHCLILHYCIVHLVFLNSNYKFFTDT